MTRCLFGLSRALLCGWREGRYPPWFAMGWTILGNCLCGPKGAFALAGQPKSLKL
jgi:hypothetical protein